MDILILYFNHLWGYVELAGTLASLICVYLAIKQNIWTWFWGAIGVALFGPLFFHYLLYSDALLQILFFLPMQILGFYWWKKGKNNESIPVITLKKSSICWISLSIIGLSLLNGYYMYNFTDASFPFIDAFTTWLSVFAQTLMIKKYLESWVLWIGMDCIAIPVYFLKGIVVVSGLYVLFLILAILGYYSWHKSLNVRN